MTARLSLGQNLFGSLLNHSRDFLDLPALQDDRVGRVVAPAPNSFASACSMVGGGRRSFAEMIIHAGSSPAAESLCPKRGNHFVKHALGKGFIKWSMTLQPSEEQGTTKHIDQ